MNLDEIEKLARDLLEVYEASGMDHRICRALLAVLPVARAAKAWHAVNAGQHTNGPQHMLAMRDTRKALVDAVETMRAEIGGEG